MNFKNKKIMRSNTFAENINESLARAEQLIYENEFNSALNILKNIEAASQNDFSSSQKHEVLMLKLLEKYHNMNQLEKEGFYTLELALLYLAFENYDKAKTILDKLFEEANDENILLIYALLKCYTALDQDISFIEKFFNNFLENNKLSDKELEFSCKEIGTFYLKNRNNEEQGVKFYKKALELNNNCPEMNVFFLGLAIKQKHNLEEAKKYIPWALKDDKLRSLPFFLSINLALSLGDYDLYQKLYEELIEKFPDDEWTYFYQSLDKSCYGLMDDCICLLKKALEKNPQNQMAYDNLVMLSHYSPSISDNEIKSIAKGYHEKIIEPFIKSSNLNFEFTNHISNYHQRNILRIGFISGDFKTHTVFFWTKGLLERFPRKNLEIYCYVNNEKNPLSESLHDLSDSVIYVDSLSDEALAKKIFQDQIHILIDLSGHTADNRLKVFGLKAAPIQMTWLGQAGSTGLKEIDYIIADKFVIKEEEELHYTEKICHLPFAAAYPAANYTHFQINESLANEDGQIVFGSFNSCMKINPTVIRTWTKVLQAVPNSKILISNYLLIKENYKKEIIKSFQEFGISESRMEFEMPRDKSAHLLRFSRIDIALDPFPFNGGTTTHETLMMSVPLVALNGKRWASRMSADVLCSANLNELIAEDIDEYINKLINLAKSPAEIIKYKKTIRKKYLNSPAADMESFASQFAGKLEKIWQEYISNN